MANTTNYNFIKPGANDYYDIGDQNDNWDAADTILKEHEDAIEALEDHLEGTLTAGQTSITISDPSITTNGIYHVGAEPVGGKIISPKTVACAAGSITMTFKAQTQNIRVVVKKVGTY